MILKLLNFRSGTITSAAMILAISALGSRFLGLLRDRILAGKFGAGDDLDVYFAAFRIPDFIFNILIAGAISAAFIPIFIELYKKDKNEAWRVSSNFINISLIGLVGISIILVAAAPLIMPFVVPGFDDEKLATASDLTRIIFISPFFLALSAIFAGMLHSFNRFIAYALSPLMYNLGIIFGALVLVDYWGVYGLAWGVVLGAVAHFLVQVPSVFFSGFRWRRVFLLSDVHFIKIIKLMVPRSLGLGAFQINLWVTTAIASTLSVGSVAIFHLANNIQYIPIGIIGIAYATAAFPTLSHAAAERNYDKFFKEFRSSFWRILVLSAFAAVALFVFRDPISQIILGVGKFGDLNVRVVSYLLGFFAIGVVPYSLIPIISRAFYSLQNTKIPVIINTGGMALNIILSVLLVFVFQLNLIGLALAFSIAGVVNVFVLFIAFQRFSSRIT